MTESNGTSGALALAIPPALIEEIAQRAVEIIISDSTAALVVPDYLTPQEAADYMRCSKQRVYDLTSAGRLRVCTDGSWNLYRRVDLDAYLVRGASA